MINYLGGLITPLHVSRKFEYMWILNKNSSSDTCCSWLPPLIVHFPSSAHACHSPARSNNTTNSGKQQLWLKVLPCHGSAIPTPDSSVWRMPTRYICLGLQHTTFGFGDSLGMHRLLGFISGPVVPVRPYLSIFQIMHPLLVQKYVACHWRTALGVFQRPRPNTNDFLEEVFKTAKAAKSKLVHYITTIAVGTA